MKGAIRIAKKFLPTTILEAKILINLSKLFINGPFTHGAPFPNACFTTAKKVICPRLDIMTQHVSIDFNEKLESKQRTIHTFNIDSQGFRKKKEMKILQTGK